MVIESELNGKFINEKLIEFVHYVVVGFSRALQSLEPELYRTPEIFCKQLGDLNIPFIVLFLSNECIGKFVEINLLKLNEGRRKQKL